MTGLIFDRREELGEEPALHALIIGIAEYPYLKGGRFARPLDQELTGFWQLTTPVRDMDRLCRWILERKEQFLVPLATIRLLASPAQDSEFVGAADASIECLLSAAAAWRNDARGSRHSLTLFYYCGLGYGTEDDDVALMMRDVGQWSNQKFRDIVSFDNIYRGMRPASDAESIARTQFYFVDTGRADISLGRNVRNPSPVFDIPFGSRDDRVAPIFYAAVSGQWAYAQTGKGSVFVNALLPALVGGAASRTEEYVDGELVWEVTVNSLNRELEDYFDHIGERSGVKLNQAYSLGGSIRDARIVRLDRSTAESRANFQPPGRWAGCARFGCRGQRLPASSWWARRNSPADFGHEAAQLGCTVRRSVCGLARSGCQLATGPARHHKAAGVRAVR